MLIYIIKLIEQKSPMRGGGNALIVLRPLQGSTTGVGMGAVLNSAEKNNRSIVNECL